jgi:hypothetical protein
LEVFASKTGGRAFNLATTKVPHSMFFFFFHLLTFPSSTGLKHKKKDDEKIVSEVFEENVYRYLGAIYDNALISDVLPSRPLRIGEGLKCLVHLEKRFFFFFDGNEPTGASVKIFGRLLGEEATITLNFGYDQHHIVDSKKFHLSMKDSLGISDLIPRLWAQQKVDEVASLPETGLHFLSFPLFASQQQLILAIVCLFVLSFFFFSLPNR